MKLLTVKDVAQTLNISPSLVYKMAESHKLPCIRIGDCIRFSTEQIEMFLSQNTKEHNHD
jgi:excisionase family DNA binding protein